MEKSNESSKKFKKDPMDYSLDDIDCLTYIYPDDTNPLANLIIEYNKKNRHLPMRNIREKLKLEQFLFCDDDLLEKVNHHINNKNKSNKSQSEIDQITINNYQSSSNNKESNHNQTSLTLDHNYNITLSTSNNKINVYFESDHNELASSVNRNNNNNNNNIGHSDDYYSDFESEQSIQDEETTKKSLKWCICSNHQDTLGTVACSICTNWYHKNCFISSNKKTTKNDFDDDDEGDDIICYYCDQNVEMIKKFSCPLKRRGLHIDHFISSQTSANKQEKIKNKTNLNSSKNDELDSQLKEKSSSQTSQNDSKPRIQVKFQSHIKKPDTSKKTSPTTTVNNSKDNDSILENSNTGNKATNKAKTSKDCSYDNFFENTNNTSSKTIKKTIETSKLNVNNNSSKKTPGHIKLIQILSEKRSQMSKKLLNTPTTPNHQSTHKSKPTTPISTESSSTNIFLKSQNEKREKNKLRLKEALIQRKYSQPATSNSSDDSSTIISDEEIGKIVEQIDEEIFQLNISNLNKYSQKHFAIYYNVKAADNDVFYRKILNGTLKPCDIAKMASQDMANEKMQQERRKYDTCEDLKEFYSKVQNDKSTFLIKKTHKGEEYFVQPLNKDFSGVEDVSDNSDEETNEMNLQNCKEKISTNTQINQDELNHATSYILINSIPLNEPISQLTEANSPQALSKPPVLSNKNNERITSEPTEIVKESSSNLSTKPSSSNINPIPNVTTENSTTDSRKRPLENTNLAENKNNKIAKLDDEALNNSKTSSKIHHDTEFNFDTSYVPPTSPSSSLQKNTVQQEEQKLLEWNGYIDNTIGIGKALAYVRGQVLTDSGSRKLISNKSSFMYRICNELLRNFKTFKIEMFEKKAIYRDLERMVSQRRQICYIKFEPNINNDKSLLKLPSESKSITNKSAYYYIFNELSERNRDVNKEAFYVGKIKIQQKEYRDWIDNIYLINLVKKLPDDIKKTYHTLNNKYHLPLKRDNDYLIAVFISKETFVLHPASSISAINNLDENTSSSISSPSSNAPLPTSGTSKRKLSNKEVDENNEVGEILDTDKSDEEIAKKAKLNNNIQSASIGAASSTTTVNLSRDPRLNRVVSASSQNPTTTIKPIKDSTISSSSSSSSVNNEVAREMNDDIIQEQVGKFLSNILEQTKQTNNNSNELKYSHEYHVYASNFRALIQSSYYKNIQYRKLCIEGLAMDKNLRKLTNEERLKLKEEFDEKLPDVIMIVLGCNGSEETSTKPNKKQSCSPKTNSTNNNINNELKNKEKWCGPSKEQFVEKLNLHKNKSIDLSHKNSNWNLNESNFEIRHPSLPSNNMQKK